MVDEEASVGDAVEQEQALEEQPPPGRTDDIEAPEADAAEQRAPVGPGQFPVEAELGPEVDEADAAEQAFVVESDEDEYR